MEAISLKLQVNLGQDKRKQVFKSGRNTNSSSLDFHRLPPEAGITTSQHAQSLVPERANWAKGPWDSSHLAGNRVTLLEGRRVYGNVLWRALLHFPGPQSLQGALFLTWKAPIFCYFHSGKKRLHWPYFKPHQVQNLHTCMLTRDAVL